MKKLLDHLWLMALLCVASGLVSWRVLATYAPPQGRVQAWNQWYLVVQWYAAALFLFLAYLWRLGTTGRPPEQVPGCGTAVVLVVCAILAFWLLAGLALPND